jgi:hypothetical protein
LTKSDNLIGAQTFFAKCFFLSFGMWPTSRDNAAEHETVTGIWL